MLRLGTILALRFAGNDCTLVSGWMACGSCEKPFFCHHPYHSCTSGSLFSRLDSSGNESLYILAVWATLLQKALSVAMPGFCRVL